MDNQKVTTDEVQEIANFANRFPPASTRELLITHVIMLDLYHEIIKLRKRVEELENGHEQS